MANQSRSGQSRAAATAPNSAALGVILIVAAVVIALLLFNAGGGGADVTTGGGTAADQANGTAGTDGSTDTTTTTQDPTLVQATPPGNLEVLVANGSGTSGRAGETADKLRALGYTNIQAVNGIDTPSTRVYFAPGLDADGLALARTMNLQDDRAQPIPTVSPLKEPSLTVMLIVLVGPDFDPATATFGAATIPTN